MKNKIITGIKRILIGIGVCTGILAAIILAFGLVVTDLAERHEFSDILPGSITHLALGNTLAFAVQPDGELWSWGMIIGEDVMQRGNHVFPMGIVDIPGHVIYVSTAGSPGGHGEDIFLNYAANNYNHAMAITADGGLYAWGVNRQGQLGNGTYSFRPRPERVMDNVVSVSTEFAATIAITADGVLYGWGDNNRGQLGCITTTPFSSNTPVQLMTDVVAASNSHIHVLAIREDGTLWGWGNAAALGVGIIMHESEFEHRSFEDNVHPTPIKIMEDVVAIAASTANSFAITSDGTLWGWGRNWHGWPGNGERGVVPFPIPIMENAVQVATGQWGQGLLHTAVVTADGGLYTWGYNIMGQLGVGDRVSRNTPQRIMDDIVRVFVGRASMMAVDTDGRIWTWGRDTLAQPSSAPRAFSGNLRPALLLDGRVMFDINSASD